MSILSVVQNVCLAVGLDKPDIVLSSTDREMQEMVRIANEVAQRIRDAEFDWQTLQAIKTLNGDGVTEAFDLPDDYARMQTTARLWSSRWSWGLEHITNTDDWLETLVVPVVPVSGQWTIYGDQIHILPMCQSSETVRFFYISKNVVKPASGSSKPLFTLDDDTFRLSERVLELGMIWQYRSQKGAASDDDETNFDRALYTAMNNDIGSKPVVSGNSRKRAPGVKRAFPYTVGGV